MHCERHNILWKRIQAEIDSLDLAHDQLHVLRVYRWAIRIAEDLNVCPDLCGAAALLHDIVNIPKESELRAQGSTLSAIKGSTLLPTSGYSADETQQIVEGIRTCSWSKGLEPTNDIGRVLQDADRLDAIGAIGIARNMACAQAMSSRGNAGQFYHEGDPLGKGSRTLNDKRYAIDHFSIKLLRLSATLHSTLAQKEAERRHQFLLAFLNELDLDVR